MLRGVFAFLAALALARCGVELTDSPGRACDEFHSCRADRQCIAGLCVDRDAGGSAGGAGGGTAGGGGGGGGGTAGGVGGGGLGGGGGSVVLPLWRQSLHGFSGKTEDNGCTAEIDSLRDNRVNATIKNANDQSDTATADQLDAGSLPTTGNGRIRGRFQLPATLKLTNNSPFVWLGHGGKPLVALAFNSAGQLVVSSASGMIGPGSLSDSIGFGDGGFRPNVDYLVEVGWQRSVWRRVWVNGLMVAEVANLGDAGALELPDQLRMGVLRYDGDAGSGWSVSLFDWQLTDDPSVVLSD